MSESIAHEKETRGTETSKYPEEEKETSISQVAASERERGQTFGRNTEGVRTVGRIMEANRRVWESPPENVRAM